MILIPARLVADTLEGTKASVAEYEAMSESEWTDIAANVRLMRVACTTGSPACREIH